MKEFVKKYGFNKYSQNGEDGVIEECIKRIGIKNGIAIEFGAPTKKFCSNIYNIYEKKFIVDKNDSWVFYWLDQDPQDTGVDKAFITPENVNELRKCDILSIDIDGNDFNVWEAYKGKPAIVIIEINSSLDPDVEFFHPDRGASFCTMNRLADDKGYFLLCHTGNCIYVLNEYKHLFPEIEEITSEKFFNHSWLELV